MACHGAPTCLHSASAARAHGHESNTLQLAPLGNLHITYAHVAPYFTEVVLHIVIHTCHIGWFSATFFLNVSAVERETWEPSFCASIVLAMAGDSSSAASACTFFFFTFSYSSRQLPSSFSLDLRPRQVLSFLPLARLLAPQSQYPLWALSKRSPSWPQ